MSEYLDEAKNELKRVDHLIYVSLKYTRTVDVIRNILKRMISSSDFCFLFLLEKAKKKKKSIEIPSQPRKICDVLKGLYPDDIVLAEFIDFYLLLRDLIKAKYTKREEYRRHVTMISNLESGDIVNVDIDLLHVYYEKMKKFIIDIEEKKES